MAKTTAQTIQKSLDKKWAIRANTRHPDGDNFDGYVTHIKRRFIVMREVVDFELNGHVVIPKGRISSCRDNKYDAHSNGLLAHNGLRDRIRPLKWMEGCSSLADVLDEIRRRRIWPAVEFIINDEAEFYLGAITEVSDKTVSILGYDAAAEWEGEVTLPIDDIFAIQINSRYCKAFNAYMKWYNPLPKTSG